MSHSRIPPSPLSNCDSAPKKKKKKCDALQKLYYLNICTVTFWKTVYACNCMNRGVSVFTVALSIEELVKHHMRWENIHKQLVN
jgi:hypothetical protein